ncbi:hypothetical protein Trisim1_006918 [Trichoderma cf. simile WF8]
MALILRSSSNRIQTEQSRNQPIVQTLSPTSVSGRAPLAEASPYPDATQALLSSLPPQRDIEILVNNLSGISIFFYQCSSKPRSSWPRGIAKDHISEVNLLYPESNPILLARQMLLFVAGLQHLSPTKSIPGLTKHHHAIMEQLADSAIRLVNSNDALLNTLEGLENLMFECFYHIDKGNIRRSWMTLRRAVMTAQLLGLHRSGHHRFKAINRQNDNDPAFMWISVVSMEQFLSLLLGLPASSSGADFTISEAIHHAVENGNFSMLISCLARKIIERNQINTSYKALELTQEIDQDLLRVSGQLQPVFWRTLDLAGFDPNSAEAFYETRRLWDHMYYYSLLIQLHLPYMLNPIHVSQRIYSRIACAHASREILIRQTILCTFKPATAGCKLGEFVTLITGMTLILAHISGQYSKGTENLLAHQRLGDRATVKQALVSMESMSEMHEDVLAAKCAALLETLLDMEARLADRHLHSGQGDDKYVMFIKVPYVGAIRISQDGISMAPSDLEQERVPCDGVTIGGFGSIYVRTPEDGRETRRDASTPSAAAALAGGASSVSQSEEEVTEGSSGEFPTLDHTITDAATDVEDWVFQGFDTAFFNSLMRGAGEQLLNSTEAEEWNYTSLT